MTTAIDRRAWLAERRAAVVADYDGSAATYTDDLYRNDAQQEWVRRLLAERAPGVVLDAPCGTGRYFPLVTAAGWSVVGVDQSAGMLDQARRRALASELHHVGLQEIDVVARFDAAMTIDGMEHVPPDDWPVVLATVHRTLRPGAPWYLTVEEDDDRDAIDRAFEAGVAQGWPIVRGEVVEGDVAGYHYYPGRQTVLSWFAAEGLAVIDEGFTPYDGWGYRHFLLR